jgi:hypothetical protein
MYVFVCVHACAYAHVHACIKQDVGMYIIEFYNFA